MSHKFYSIRTLHIQLQCHYVKLLNLTIHAIACRWAKQAVSPSVVESIYSAWERERHHSAERHLYPDVISALQKIKEEHPNVIIGAVTDGKANPMLMVCSTLHGINYFHTFPSSFCFSGL